MSSANKVELSRVKEVTYGVNPGGNLQRTRYTKENFEKLPETVKSAEITTTRALEDEIRTGVSSQGGFDAELSYGSFDDLFEAALMADATWSAVDTVAGTGIAAVASGNHFTDAGTDFDDIAVGDWIKVSGFANAANNGWFKVVTKPGDGDITVSGGTLVNESAGPSVTIVRGGKIEDGSTKASFTIERKHADLSNIFKILTGQVVDRLAINHQRGQALTLRFDFVGKNCVAAGASAGSGYVAANTNPVMAAHRHIAAIFEAQVRASMQSLSLQIGNNQRKQSDLTTTDVTGVVPGDFDIQGSFEAYLNDNALATKFDGDTATSIAIVLIDRNGKAYVIDLPSVRIKQLSEVNDGRNTDVVSKAQIVGLGPGGAKAMRIFRFP